MKKPVHCKTCGSDKHYTYACYQNRKPIIIKHRPNKQSAKEIAYQDWKETIARPALIARDGNQCSCCHRPAYDGEKLDIEHTKGKGSHPELKKDLNNLTLMCRIPCHKNKTDGKKCLHRSDSIFTML